MSVSTYIQLHEVIHSLTLLNSSSREKVNKRYQSTREDVVNGLSLVLPDQIKLSEKEIEVADQLESHFGEEPFTYLQACFKLRKAHSTMKRLLMPLKAYRIIRDIPRASNERREMVVTKIRSKALLEKESIFEEMMKDWEDFQGFTDLTYRT